MLLFVFLNVRVSNIPAHLRELTQPGISCAQEVWARTVSSSWHLWGKVYAGGGAGEWEALGFLMASRVGIEKVNIVNVCAHAHACVNCRGSCTLPSRLLLYRRSLTKQCCFDLTYSLDVSLWPHVCLFLTRHEKKTTSIEVFISPRWFCVCLSVFTWLPLSAQHNCLAAVWSLVDPFAGQVCKPYQVLMDARLEACYLCLSLALEAEMVACKRTTSQTL